MSGNRKTQSTAKLKSQAAIRLDKPLGWCSCDRKDVMIILVICFLYSCLAFSNLGTFKVPSTLAPLEEDALIEFQKTEHIVRLKYYAGYGEGRFAVLWSNNGTDFEPAFLNGTQPEIDEISQQSKNLYKWQEYGLDIEAKYVKLIPLEGTVPFMEIAFFGEDGRQIIPEQVRTQNGVLSEWSDEQTFVPFESTYMTDMYFDELYHVRTAYEHLHGIRPYEISHPPLGKLLIAIGIQMFGMNPFGWRFMGALAGVCMIPVIYVFARMLFSARRYAIYSAVLLTSDCMHYAQTRIGTVDSFSVLWIMAMYLFMYRYAGTNFNREPLKVTLMPLFWCGLFFGLGAATKWLSLYAGMGLLVIYAYLMIQRYQEYKLILRNRKRSSLAKEYGHKLRLTLLWSVLFFVVIPITIYLTSYIPYMFVTDGQAYTLEDVIRNQITMFDYHSSLNPDRVHPFASAWYTWPLDVRPVLFFSHQTGETIATLSTMGNPFLWWIGLTAVVWLMIWVLRDPHVRSFNLLFLSIGALAQYVPWWFIARETFIYHYFATVPFLILFIAAWLQKLQDRFRWGKAMGYCVVGVCAGGFALFYPVVTGIPVSRGYIDSVRWFHSWPFY